MRMLCQHPSLVSVDLSHTCLHSASVTAASTQELHHQLHRHRSMQLLCRCSSQHRSMQLLCRCSSAPFWCFSFLRRMSACAFLTRMICLREPQASGKRKKVNEQVDEEENEEEKPEEEEVLPTKRGPCSSVVRARSCTRAHMHTHATTRTYIHATTRTYIHSFRRPSPPPSPLLLRLLLLLLPPLRLFLCPYNSCCMACMLAESLLLLCLLFLCCSWLQSRPSSG